MIRDKQMTDPVNNEIGILNERVRNFKPRESNDYFKCMMREMLGERIKRYVPYRKWRILSFIKAFKFSNR